jgi:hypothetical protein
MEPQAMMKFIDGKSGNMSALIIVAVCGFAGVMYQNYAQEKGRIERGREFREARAARNAEPIENWLNQRAVFVPDFILGDDVKVIFDRDPVKQPFTSSWSVTIITADANLAAICDVSGFKNYQTGETLAATGVSMATMFGPKPCSWAPGEFVMRATWKISREGYEDRIITRTSNPFRVLAPGSQLDVTPEQVQKLEEAQ